MKTRQAEQKDLDQWAALRHALWPKYTITELRDEAEEILNVRWTPKTGTWYKVEKPFYHSTQQGGSIVSKTKII